MEVSAVQIPPRNAAPLKRKSKENVSPVIRKKRTVDGREPAETAYKCRKCEYTTNRKGNLQRHANSASCKVKQFRCETCGKRFTFLTNLKRHRKTHKEILRQLSESFHHNGGVPATVELIQPQVSAGVGLAQLPVSTLKELEIIDLSEEITQDNGWDTMGHSTLLFPDSESESEEIPCNQEHLKQLMDTENTVTKDNRWITLALQENVDLVPNAKIDGINQLSTIDNESPPAKEQRLQDEGDDDIIFDDKKYTFPEVYMLDGKKKKTICAGCSREFTMSFNLKQYLLNTPCVRDSRLQCEKCRKYFPMHFFHKHYCSPYHIKHKVPPYTCLCGNLVDYIHHTCKLLLKVYSKLKLKAANHDRKQPKNDIMSMDLPLLLKCSENAMGSNHILLQRFGCAILLAYSFLFRTSKGANDDVRTQSVWSLQKEHLAIEGDQLHLRCWYQSVEYNKLFKLTKVQQHAFTAILKSSEMYIFSAVKAVVQTYLQENFGINLIIARKAAISTHFWKLMETYENEETPEKIVNDVLMKLSLLTTHTNKHQPTIETNARYYLDKNIVDLGVEYLKNKTRPPYNTNFQLPSFINL